MLHDEGILSPWNLEPDLSHSSVRAQILTTLGSLARNLSPNLETYR